ncbi:MAG: hypothetical protein IJC87_00430 [Clostridia bacterium]|nr:hypothetical protein [Clostridia bacterium]
MLKNKGLRFLLTIIIAVVAFIVCMAIGSSSEELGGIAMVGMVVYALWIIHQLQWDVMGGGNGFLVFLQNALKIVYFVLGIAAVLLGVIMFFTTLSSADGYSAGVVLLGAVSTFLVGIAFEDFGFNEKFEPFAPIICLVGSILIGLLFNLLGELKWIGGVVTIVVGVVLFIVIAKSEKKTSKSSSYSKGSYSSSSYSYSNANATKVTDSSRPSESINKHLSQAMHRVGQGVEALYALTVLGHGVTLFPTVYSHTGSGYVEFVLDVRINGGSGITSEDDLNEVKDKRDQVIEKIMDRLYDHAEKEIESLREKYNDYDTSVDVNVKIGNVHT